MKAKMYSQTLGECIELTHIILLCKRQHTIHHRDYIERQHLLNNSNTNVKYLVEQVLISLNTRWMLYFDSLFTASASMLSISNSISNVNVFRTIVIPVKCLVEEVINVIANTIETWMLTWLSPWRLGAVHLASLDKLAIPGNTAGR